MCQVSFLAFFRFNKDCNPKHLGMRALFGLHILGHSPQGRQGRNSGQEQEQRPRLFPRPSLLSLLSYTHQDNLPEG